MKEESVSQLNDKDITVNVRLRVRMRKIEEVQKMVENDVFKLEGVVCVYIGEKDNKEVIKVGLKRMDPNITNLIPKQVEGYDVEVENADEPSIDW